MHVLGKPVRVCPDHVQPLDCPGRCLGADISELDELRAAAHTGCGVCRLRRDANGRDFKIVRKCGHPGCYSRFRISSYDELHIGEWFGAARDRLLRRAA